jgi:hypothetical protein
LSNNKINKTLDDILKKKVEENKKAFKTEQE